MHFGRIVTELCPPKDSSLIRSVAVLESLNPVRDAPEIRPRVAADALTKPRRAEARRRAEVLEVRCVLRFDRCVGLLRLVQLAGFGRLRVRQPEDLPRSVRVEPKQVNE